MQEEQKFRPIQTSCPQLGVGESGAIMDNVFNLSAFLPGWLLLNKGVVSIENSYNALLNKSYGSSASVILSFHMSEPV